jgi:RHS repeat-associated protein
MPDGRWLLVGGLRSDGSAASPVLVDGRGTVTPVAAALHEPRTGHSATLLPDGTVLIIGGLTRGGRVAASMERFDPASGRFEVIANAPAIARAFHTATVVSDGRVLIVGGADEGQHPSNDVLLLDPTTLQAPTVLATLPNPRLQHDATLLADGRVRLSGGTNEAGRPVSLDEMVDPLTGFIAPGGAPDAMGDLFVIESTPVSGATDVSRDITVRLRFSTPAQVWSVNDRTVTLSNDLGNPVPIAVVPVESGMLAFLRPLVRLDSGRSYSMVLDGVSAAGGRRLGPLMITFTTEGAPVPQPIDDELWTPDPANGVWATGRGPSPWEQLPRLQAAQGVTAVSGQTLRLNGLPLAGVRLSIGNQMATSDRTGRFLIESAPSGRQVLLLDGRPISTPGRAYGVFEVGVDVIAGKTNGLPFTSWMTRLDTQHEIAISSPTTVETVLVNPWIPGLEVRLPVGTIIRDIDHEVVTKVSITAIPLDRTPFPLAPGVRPPVYFTLQPGGGYLETTEGAHSSGARIIYPNNLRWKPGSQADFWHYDPEDRGWFIYGNGSVTQEGTRVIPDPGVGIYEFTGAMVGSPLFAPAEGPPPCSACDDGDPVDLATSLFVYRHVDLYLPDVLPITLTRTYRTRDNTWRAFGIGSNHPYNIFIVGDKNPYTYADIILADGGRVHYTRISAGTGFTDAIYEHTSTPSDFYKSRISWNTARQGWDLRLLDGTVYKFPDAEFASLPEQAALVGITDRFGNSITLTRDTIGALTTITSPNGRSIQFTYDGYNRIIQAQDNIGRTVNYEYDASGRLWKVTDPGQGITVFTYDSSHRMIDITDPLGTVYLTNEYNLSGRVIAQTLGDGSQYHFAYTVGANGKITQTDVTDQRGFVRRVTFDASGYWLTDTRAVGQAESRTITRERNAATHFVTSETDALGHRTTYDYDIFGNAQIVTRLAETQNPIPASATFEPTFQRRSTVTDPLNHTTTYGYDTHGALTSITDYLGHGVTITPNGSGDVVGTSDAAGTTQMFYTQGLVTRFVNGAGASVERTLDAAGRPVAQMDALGNKTVYEYTPLNQLAKITDPRQGTTEFTYDFNGNLRTVKDARNGLTSYTYDQLNRLVTRTDALLHVDRYIYDQSGNVRQVVDRRGLVTTYDYDALNRMKYTFHADGSTTSYTYDKMNRITGVTDSIAGISTITYDSLGRLTAETTPRGAVTYTYDLADRRATMTVEGQQTITYGYDDANRLTSLTQGSAVVSFSYDAANRRTITTLPNGTSIQYGYDAASRVASQIYKQGPTVLGDLTYGYDAAGHRTEVGGSFAQLVLPASVSGATYNTGNQLTQWQSTTLTYDANGNLLTHGAREFAWDARNRLEATSGVVASSFVYDAFGRRIVEVANGTTTTFVHDAYEVVQDSVAGGQTGNVLFGPSIDEALTRTDNAGIHGVFSDAIGSVRALTNQNGDVETTYTYEPFGRAQRGDASSSNTTQFAGREADASGLYYYRARYLDPMTNRFLSEDPIGFGGGPNAYAYADNNPVSHNDPFGLQATDWKEVWNGIKNVGGWYAIRGRAIASQARADAEKTNLPGANDGLQDAYRHCLWSCRLTQELNATAAQLITDEHENAGERQGDPGWRKAMDLANNAAGRACAGKTDREGKRRDCADTCWELLWKGGLYGPGGLPFQMFTHLGQIR